MGDNYVMLKNISQMQKKFVGTLRDFLVNQKIHNTTKTKIQKQMRILKLRSTQTLKLKLTNIRSITFSILYLTMEFQKMKNKWESNFRRIKMNLYEYMHDKKKCGTDV